MSKFQELYENVVHTKNLESGDWNHLKHMVDRVRPSLVTWKNEIPEDKIVPLMIAYLEEVVNKHKTNGEAFLNLGTTSQTIRDMVVGAGGKYHDISKKARNAAIAIAEAGEYVKDYLDKRGE